MLQKFRVEGLSFENVCIWYVKSSVIKFVYFSGVEVTGSLADFM